MLKAEYMKNSHGDGPIQCCKEAVGAFNPSQLLSTNEWMWHPSRGKRFMDVLNRNSPPPRFYQSIQALSHRQCLNPRDKIYSMLSLATHPIYQDIIPNYRDDVSTVYINLFTRMVRENDGGFNCFMGSGFGFRTPGLPSWVRESSSTTPLGVVAVEERRIRYVALYQASLAQRLQPVWNENRELHYRGTYADRVKAVGLKLPSSERDLSEILGQWLDLCKEVMGTCEPKRLRNAFFRILCGDVCKTLDGGAGFRRAREADFLHHAWDQLLEGDVNALDMRAYGWGLTFAVWGRCFFTTHSVKMGLCHSNTRSGDKVWVMRGIQVPFVVRPLETADAGCAGQYFFLGEW